MTRTRLSVRLLAVCASAVALSTASATVASAAQTVTGKTTATTTSTGTITLKIASVKPRIFHSDAISGTAPSWAKTVTIQRRKHGSAAWQNAFKETVTKGKYKDALEFTGPDYDVRATANAVGKFKATSTKSIEVEPTALEYDSPTLTGPVSTTPISTGDAVYVDYSFTCPTGTPAHGFALVSLVGGEADAVIDDDASGTTGSGTQLLESDGQLFGVEGVGAGACTWSVQIAY